MTVTSDVFSCFGCLSATPITKNLQLGFMDNLLSTYRELEHSFMINVYELFKAFRFRTLWEGNDPLANFQRIASENARGTGQLNGIIQLTDVLRNMEQTETKAVQCFTNNVYTTHIKKWSFDKTRNKDVSYSASIRTQEGRNVGDERHSQRQMSVFSKHYGRLLVRVLRQRQFFLEKISYLSFIFNKHFGLFCQLPAVIMFTE